jgi:HNH endonuclease
VAKLSKELRQQVFNRANSKCEYCLLAVADTPYGHQIDHIIPRQHGGKDELENLALCCSRCNRHKGPNLASLDPESGEIIALFNPRKQTWSEHFRLEDGVFIALSAVGQVSITILKLNTEQRIAERKVLISQKKYL